MKSWILLLILTLTQVDAEPKAWPNIQYKHVVAYCYDFSQDPRGSSITFEDGSLHKGVIRATTVRLTDAQIKQVVGMLNNVSDKEDGEVECYEPHHAFVFYDAEWKVVASIDICFLCEDYVARPKGVSENIDLGEMLKFCQLIGLPFFEKGEAYTALFKQEQARVEVEKNPEAPEKKLKQGDISNDPFQNDKLLEPTTLPLIE